MRTILIGVAVLAAACGSNKKSPGDGKPPGDGPKMDAFIPPIDGPPLATCTPVSGMTMSANKIGQVADAAMVAKSPPLDGRLFVVQRNGQVRIFDPMGNLLPDPFIDITTIPGHDDFAAGGEQGLLGLAFHPYYALNNYFYIWYTNGPCPGGPPPSGACANVLERFTASAADPNKADPTSGQIILSIPDFASNHNGGMLEFGPNDGFLYVGTGDGGAGDDPAGNGQNTNALLAKILRIDVDHPSGGKMYGIPADNPFASGQGGAPEVFMYGVRNPWRWTFDTKTGDMWIADVGQNIVEELDMLTPAQQKGANLGWSVFEANLCHLNNPMCGTLTTTFQPQFTHTHTNGWNAIIGGQVYRGPCYPDITGYYFFSDNGASPLMRAQANTDGSLTVTQMTGTFPGSPASIHADARGELYEVTTDGSVYHLEAGP